MFGTCYIGFRIIGASVSEKVWPVSRKNKIMSSKRRIDLSSATEKRSKWDQNGVINLDEASEDGVVNVNSLTGTVFSRRYFDILKKRKELPCWEARSKFLSMLEENQVVLLVGATGSGKTTQIPQFVLQAGYSERGMIACTQPRRVAPTGWHPT